MKMTVSFDIDPMHAGDFAYLFEILEGEPGVVYLGRKNPFDYWLSMAVINGRVPEENGYQELRGILLNIIPKLDLAIEEENEELARFKELRDQRIAMNER
jgi:hypothetical protein